ncbi:MULTISPECIES: DUF1858 domain-containing protein [Treponema]|jgi:hybrid cluster-associated redox disulfide protein|uniref:DUF1858 domain-containing protein n=1 Tax=Treponema TaxID=157 RepID=UPI0023571B22|nr:MULTISPECIES: DUF1858 domain-containing protein [Treponema]MCI5541279.1 DUF1858 domain-containing protein [Treponema berlinense]MDY3707364.1 DUF1858 domain-containing protein [Treponema berlinense]
MTDLESKKMISGDMLVGQIVNEYPQAVEILMEVGMHCLGCPSSQVERLEDAAIVHGLDPKMVVDTVNKKLFGGAA